MCLWKFCLGRRRVAEFVSKLLVARVKIDPMWLDWQVSPEAFRVSTLQPSSSSGKPSILKANNLLGCNESCGHLRKCDDTFRNASKCQENKERGPHNVKKLSAPCAEICHLDSQVAAHVPIIEMHDNFEKESAVHRERLFNALSLVLALLSKIIVHFDSSVSDKL